MAVEVALQVEVGQVLVSGHRQQRAQRSIGVDGVLVLQVVSLDVLVDRLGDLRARHQGRRGLAEESQQFRRYLSRALENRGGALDLHAILIELDAAAALAGILHLAMHTLLQLLVLGEQHRDGLTQCGEVGGHRLEVIIKGGGRGSDGSHGLHGGRGHNYRGGYLGLHGLGLGGRLRLHRGLRGSRHRGGLRLHGGSRYRGNRGIYLLLCYTLGGLGGGGSNSRHYTGR